MSSAIETIEEIEQNSQDMQKKLLSLSAPAEGKFTDKQIIMLETARNALGMFQRFELAQLKKAFR